MSAARKKDISGFKEVRNSKASHKYFIGQKFEAGIALRGTEVKSIRAGKGQISEAFVRIEHGNAVLYHAFIDEYVFGTDSKHNPTRPRRLLLHKREIRKLQTGVETSGETIIPLRMYLSHGLIKIEIALCKGKKLYDKREDLKRKVATRETERVLKSRSKS